MNLKKCFRKTWLLSFLLPLAGVIFYCFVWKNPYPFPDTRDYITLSQSIIHYVSSGDFDQGCREDYRRTPGYPFLIALFGWAGRHAFFIVNFLCLYGIAFFSLKLAQSWKIKSWHFFAFFLILSPGLLTMGTVPLTGVPCAFFVLASFYFLESEKLTSKKVAISALLLSFSTLVRPITLYFFIPQCFWLLIRRKSYKYFFLFAFLANVFPTIWTIRNYKVSGYFVYTTISSENLLYYKAGNYLAYKENKSFEEIHKRLKARVEHVKNPILQHQLRMKLGFSIILDNFTGFAIWGTRNFLNFFMPDITPALERLQITTGNRGTYNVLNRKGLWAATKYYFRDNLLAGIIAVLYSLFYLVLWISVGFGVYSLYKKREFTLLFSIALFIFYFAILPLGNLDWRFRMPITPFLLLLGYYGLENFFSKYIDSNFVT